MPTLKHTHIQKHITKSTEENVLTEHVSYQLECGEPLVVCYYLFL